MVSGYDELRKMLDDDDWAGQTILRDALPRVPRLADLPLPSSNYRGRVVRVEGIGGVTDELFICMKSAADTYSWVSIVTGG